MNAPRHRLLIAAAGLLVMGGLGPNRAAAHDLDFTQVLVVFHADGTYRIDVRTHLDQLAMGVAPSTPMEAVLRAMQSLPPEELNHRVEDLRELLRKRLRIHFDDNRMRLDAAFPELDLSHDTLAYGPMVIGSVARFEGKVPPLVDMFRFGASRAFQLVQLTILDEASATGVKYTLTAGDDCPPYRMHDPAAARQQPPQQGVVLRYLILGYEHILPRGLDHILFVLGLFLLSTKLRPLLWQITAFTIAHSVTLALSMGNIASLPSTVVEPLIALSIAYVAIENLFTRDLKPWRPAVVFAFGLLHGMGFAGVLRELGMPEGGFVPALVAFNVGVELGQLSVVALAFLAVGWFRNRKSYRARIVIPLSAMIALIGLYWTVERIGWGG